MTENETAGNEIAGVIAPPPLIFLAGLAVGLVADAVFGLPSLPAPPGVRIAAAIVLGGVGAASIAAALGRFGQAKTPPQPWKPTTALATGGVYRLTRNPMYLGMALLLAALAIGFASWGTLAAFPFVIAFADRFVIQREERYLHKRFGSAYDAYRAEVRRWL